MNDAPEPASFLTPVSSKVGLSWIRLVCPANTLLHTQRLWILAPDLDQDKADLSNPSINQDGGHPITGYNHTHTHTLFHTLQTMPITNQPTIHSFGLHEET